MYLTSAFLWFFSVLLFRRINKLRSINPPEGFDPQRPQLHDRETLAQVLVSFGTKLVREVSDPAVIAVFRLAIAEVIQAPEVARALDSKDGRQVVRPCGKSWPRPRRPDCSQVVLPNLPRSSPVYSGAI